MKMKMKRVSTHIKHALLAIGAVLSLFGLAHAATGGNIDPIDRFAWGTAVGWINFNPTHGGVTVYADHLEGYAWAENIGWIRLGTHAGGGTHTYGNTTSADYGVNVDASGNLSGFAWGTNVGWINFNPTHGGVTIDLATGSFDGYAWGENVGWIHFKNTGAAAYNVVAALADVSISKSVSTSSAGPGRAATAAPGETITYTLVFSNAGPGPATGVVIIDTIPVSITSSSVISSGVAITDTGASPGYVWAVQGLAPAQGGVITITGVLSPGLPAGSFSNTARMATTALDSDPGNDSDTVTITVEAPPDCPHPVGNVSITAPITGYTDTLYAFTAIVSPSNATLPITYTWQATEQGQVITSTDAPSHTVSLSWASPGVKTVTATVQNCGDTVSEMVTITIKVPPPGCPLPLENVSITGPTGGYTGTLYTFEAGVTPENATVPITYTWSPPPVGGQGTISATYQWDTPGVYTLTLVAENCTPPSTVAVSDTHTIVITSTPLVGDAYEPDDACAQASPIPVDGTMQFHTFHAPDDRDWVAFEVISGTEYLIEAQTPVDSLADVAAALFDQCGGLTQGGQDHAFTPDVRLRFTAPASGTFYLRLKNHDTTVGGPDLRYNLSVRALSQESTQGVLVLVAGRLRPNDPVQDNIYQVTDDVYRLFLQQGGYDNQRIYYLSNDQNRDPDNDPFTQDVDAYATEADLQAAITVWAMDKVGPNQAFTLYLMDHGTPDKFYLDGRSDTVSPTELDGWLGELETQNPGVRVNVIIEACHSGSFIDQLGGDGRVIIASTGSQAVAYATDRGAIFSDVFVNALERGMSLYGGYEEARGTAVQAHPDQSPGLDDDGDGQANDPDDGTEAARRGFAYVGTFPGPDNWPPYVVWATVSLISTPGVELQPNQGLLRAEVQDDTRVFAVWAVVYKPSYVPPDPSTTEEVVEEHLPTVTMLDQDGDDVYTAIYEGLNEPGRYRIVIYAVDTEEVLGRPRVVEVQLGGYQVYLPLVVRNF